MNSPLVSPVGSGHGYAWRQQHTLQQRSEALCAIGVDLLTNVFANRVTYVGVVVAAPVCWRAIRIDLGVFRDMGIHKRIERLPVCIFYYLGRNAIGDTITDSYNGFLTVSVR